MADQGATDRRATILDAALTKFSAYGVAKTSMADIATEAGMSRPALYQYFDDKEDILVALLVRILGEAGDRAIEAIDQPGSLSDRLDGFLQRWFGDLLAQLRATEHGTDLIEVKTRRAAPTVDAITRRVRNAATAQLGAVEADHLVDLLMLAPAGLKHDEPTTTRYRARLTSLAQSVAAAAEADEATP